MGKKGRLLLSLILAFFCVSVSFVFLPICDAFAHPFYAVSPFEPVLRGSFYTEFNQNLKERSFNIALASKKIDGVFLEVGEEFSFNKVVGARTEKNGFKKAKIIENGKFTDGLGGGVCQVSTTLYNAVLYANLKITEFHPHSLQVSYVSPSFDAMVSYGYADFKFINDTKNPIFIKTKVNSNKITISIYGEENPYKIVRESVNIEEIQPPFPVVLEDSDNNYGLVFGEERFLTYPKNGLKSQGYIKKYLDGKYLGKFLIRKDKYMPIQAVIVKKTVESNEDNL